MGTINREVTTGAPAPRRKKKQTDAELLLESAEKMKNVKSGTIYGTSVSDKNWTDYVEEFLCKIFHIKE